MNIKINRKIHTPIYVQIKNHIKKMIYEEELVHGFKLPSERALAKELEVHRKTVIRAYEELISEDLVTSSVSPRGYFIIYSQAQDYKRVASFSTKKYSGALDYQLKDGYVQMDQLFNKLFYGDSAACPTDQTIHLSADIISSAIFPKEELSEILQDISHYANYDWFGFFPPQGDPRLINSICNLLEKRNIHALPKEVQILTETTEALQLASQMLLSPHDTIIVEEPIVPTTFEFFQMMNINVITIPMDENGMQTDYLESLIVKYHPKYIYTIPTFHFPTAATMSLSRRYQLLEMSYKYNIPIIEEDCDSVMKYEGPSLPSIKSLDTMGNVIYTNSFVGTICPGIHIAYLVATERTIEKFSGIVEKIHAFISPLPQLVASQFIDRGYIYDYIDKLCHFGRSNRDCICQALRDTEDIDYKFLLPKGGTSLWCDINEMVNPKELLLNARQQGVAYMPGNLFFPFKDKGDSIVRLCYGNSTHDELREGVRRLSEAIRMTR